MSNWEFRRDNKLKWWIWQDGEKREATQQEIELYDENKKLRTEIDELNGLIEMRKDADRLLFWRGWGR